jgi:hypothetical protein
MKTKKNLRNEDQKDQEMRRKKTKENSNAKQITRGKCKGK